MIYNEILSGGFDYEADLFWELPAGASTNDYDLYMVNGSGNIVYSSQNAQTGTQDPYEHIVDPAQLSLAIIWWSLCPGAQTGSSIWILGGVFWTGPRRGVFADTMRAMPQLLYRGRCAG